MLKRFNHQYLDLLWEMTKRELKVRYKRTYLGFFWAILYPLMQMVVIGTVFSFIIKSENYYLFLLSGLIPWQFINTTLPQVTSSIVSQRNLLHKAPFPIEIIPFSVILANFLTFTLSSFIFIMTTICITGKSNIIVPYFSASLWILILIIGLGLITSTLNIKRRDVQFIVNTTMIPLFYVTPIMYHYSVLPSTIQSWLFINPLFSPFNLIHQTFEKTNLTGDVLLINLLTTLILLGIGMYLFYKKKDYFVDYL